MYIIEPLFVRTHYVYCLMFISVLKRTVAIRYLQSKEQSGDRKLKFDWHNLINKDPKY